MGTLRAGNGNETGGVPFIAYQATGNGLWRAGLGPLSSSDDNGTNQCIAHTLRAEGFDASEDGTGRGTPLVSVLPFDTTQITSKANRSNPRAGDPCHPLAAGAHPPTIAFGWQNAAAQGDDVREEISPTLDKSKTPAIAFSCKDHGADAGELAPTLRAMGHGASHANAGGQVAVTYAIGSHAGAADGDVSNASHASGGPVGSNISEELAYTLRAGRSQSIGGSMAVRRITPTEAERLQGFPDGYTDVPYRGKPAADGPRYKALGNSMAVPVMRWIGERIQMVDSVPAALKRCTYQ
jgi:DNA (cytosine-5)-methyltransferase 1